ncbi:MAG: hypothetical protein N5P05_002998 [Chroococcopsis gigantea SAG 12.99]|jgi:hypothetical protein|nr:hypothetical protein [Chlorogloea purpurea SAG 13.99]MDV3001392.1 hypothetical protein [Chroococcopsis gigantea SAG 12.99]
MSSSTHQFKTFNYRLLGMIGILGVCLAGVIGLQSSKLQTLTKGKLYNYDYQKDSDLEKIRLDLLKSIPPFGFQNLLADWVMLQFIQYYGDGDARKVTGYGLSPEYLDVIVKNDPYFVRAYLNISTASSINAGLPDRTIAIMNEGLKKLNPNIPEAYYVPLYKGVDELLFRGDIESARKSNELAAQWAKIAGNNWIERSADQTVKYLDNKSDTQIAQVGAWFLVWVNSPDEATRKLAKDNIEKLGGQLVISGDGNVYALPPKKP